MDLGEARGQLSLLRNTLIGMIKKDPDQEVRDIAIPVVDQVLASARFLLPEDHPIVDRVRDVVTPERVESEEPLRAADVLHVVNALYAAISGPYADWVQANRKWRG
jgi:hypothetical protein